ncbi:SGNH/GDSL hydrolase family protein [Chitinophaga sp. Cy-1792]|uniref:SGNH/GDSL hydrolase family protein n=1 Tax=Chitinophaga sp. Cy-1792 TaxID=2608339 RepID=UPI00141DF443|nr:SGNH/GDSL hydrolase family protein [Chitinophaga sp. Cy-1792]NIG53477.1 SGNH/GDSL hydrolase family protein [Chitinophaga sp. Cy-1792]
MPYTYLALGDSYTIGEAVPLDQNFPSQTCQLLGNAGFSFENPKIIAVTGWTTDELQQGIEAASIHNITYDLVTLLIGVNNQYRGGSLEEYRQQFTSLLQQAIAFSKGGHAHVIVLSIPDWGVTPFAADRDRQAIAREIDDFNAVNKAIAADFKVHYLDITPFTREATTNLQLVAEDGLHPSGLDYGRWARSLATMVEKILP